MQFKRKEHFQEVCGLRGSGWWMSVLALGIVLIVREVYVGFCALNVVIIYGFYPQSWCCNRVGIVRISSSTSCHLVLQPFVLAVLTGLRGGHERTVFHQANHVPTQSLLQKGWKAFLNAWLYKIWENRPQATAWGLVKVNRTLETRCCLLL